KKWNAYVALTQDAPQDLDRRNKLLWELKKMVTGSSHERIRQILERVSQELVVVDNEMMKKGKK
ncbi:MAG: hypothetical protein ACYTGH_13180, partial [Planctomycetota bacterium]